jgi:hypothetical protein
MTSTTDNPYPDEEFPWNFYFNGVLMPKWGACWSLASVSRFLTPEKSWDNDVGVARHDKRGRFVHDKWEGWRRPFHVIHG